MAKEKILVVDDEKAINKLVCSYLTKEQFRPFPAYTGEEALDLLKANPDVGVAILDIMLPGIDGFNLKMNVSILSLMRQCTDYALRYSHNSDRWFGPVLAKHFFE